MGKPNQGENRLFQISNISVCGYNGSESEIAASPFGRNPDPTETQEIQTAQSNMQTHIKEKIAYN